MMKKFFDYFLLGYATASVEIQKRARLLIIINILCIIGSAIVILGFLLGFKANILLPIIFGITAIFSAISLIFIKKNKFNISSSLINIIFFVLIIMLILSYEEFNSYNIFNSYFYTLFWGLAISCLICSKTYDLYIAIIIELIGLPIIAYFKITDFQAVLNSVPLIEIIISIMIFIFGNIFFYLVYKLNTNIILGLTEIINKSKDIIINLNSASKEIEAAAQEQTSGANEHASGVTEVSATLEELTITAKQITKNVGELVSSSEGVIKFLQDSEKQLLQTVSQLDDIGKISSNNATEIGALGKRAVLINDMVEMIKEIANKTNILSINASIEASRTGDMSSGFTVVAAEIRELSKETIVSAKNVEKAAKEIQDFLSSIIIATESESNKVIESGKTVKSIYDNLENIVGKINNNYSFSQKIDVSIKQQENGSRQASDTMRQMAEIARQSAETARQTLQAVQDIVNLAIELEKIIQKSKV